jgi:quercetin dioxygenase-like cupin family protein
MEFTMTEQQEARLVDYESVGDGVLKAGLDNNCYVVRIANDAMKALGALQIYEAIGTMDGAKHLSHYEAAVGMGKTPVLVYPGSDAVLFVRSGEGTVNIGGNEFAVSAETGVCVKPGEGFQLINTNDEPLMLGISVCPPCAEPIVTDTMPTQFDTGFADRVQGVDEGKREEMGDRFFQVLIAAESHGTPVTQFIGEIPQSRAAHHRHPYEEAITVLSGEGFMWTDDTKTPVRTGDIIFLPKRQAHSIECTSPGGMRLAGLFYPSMSPATNY